MCIDVIKGRRLLLIWYEFSSVNCFAILYVFVCTYLRENFDQQNTHLVVRTAVESFIMMHVLCHAR